jgi:hypothetical protein
VIKVKKRGEIRNLISCAEKREAAQKIKDCSLFLLAKTLSCIVTVLFFK